MNCNIVKQSHSLDFDFQRRPSLSLHAQTMIKLNLSVNIKVQRYISRTNRSKDTANRLTHPSISKHMEVICYRDAETRFHPRVDRNMC
uniref:AlNc14C121G6689 protein n=1 Tax=Albugo laibachii Nc14 TaxID=890382 RepID=F0WJG0_9STRA|nr:AlNc14C121G6689 [Albugo laibachii Nc14]|eukprot:CCA21409.1 AlNc14C121G6689 [Albugo laibachii Nc14]